MISTADFRNGLVVEMENDLMEIVEFQHVKPGKGPAFVRTKVRNMRTGSLYEKTFRGGEPVTQIRIDEKQMQYLYREGDHYTFMDTANYEQTIIDRESLGDSANWLQENCTCSVLFWNGRTIGVSLPNFVILRVTKCEPGFRGDTATGATKPATLESGANLNVPLFVNEGDAIRIDTRSGTYVERA